MTNANDKKPILHTIADYLKPNIVNVSFGVAAGAAGALDAKYRIHQDKREQELRRDIEELKGLDKGDGLGVLNRFQLNKLELKLKGTEFERSHPAVSYTARTLLNAALGYGAGSVLNKTVSNLNETALPADPHLESAKKKLEATNLEDAKQRAAAAVNP